MDYMVKMQIFKSVEDLGQNQKGLFGTRSVCFAEGTQGFGFKILGNENETT